MVLGKIVKSNSHTDYVCQIYNTREVATPPSRADYAFGTFVRVGLGNGRFLVGLIYDTVLLNPDFGRLGPRLSPESDLAIFSPDYLNEKATLVGLTCVGLIDAAGNVQQGVPSLSASTDALVERMDTEQVQQFHLSNPSLKLAYAPLLLSQGHPLAAPLVQTVLDQLLDLFPQQAALLSVLHNDLVWKAQINPLGGSA